jgi:hypothetical protein
MQIFHEAHTSNLAMSLTPISGPASDTSTASKTGAPDKQDCNRPATGDEMQSEVFRKSRQSD